MKTLVFADLHLNPYIGEFDRRMFTRVYGALEREQPDLVAFNGDTFDLYFDIDGRELTPKQRLEQILNTHTEFVHTMRKIPSLFLLGAHDGALLDGPPILTPPDALTSLLPKSDVAGYYFHIPRSWAHVKFNIPPNWQDVKKEENYTRAMVTSGVQLSYDISLGSPSGPLSLTPGLTEAITEFLLSGDLTRQELLGKYERGELSFWYQSGHHHQFINGMHEQHGCDKDLYYRRVADLCRSDMFREWTRRQPFKMNKTVASTARLLASLSRKNIGRFAPAYWAFHDSIVRHRQRNATRYGGMGTYPKRKRNTPLILGSDHRASAWSGPPELYIVGSPKEQTRFENGTIVNEVKGSYVVLDNREIRQVRF